MNSMKLTLIALLVFLGASVLSAQWQVYDCSVLPVEADTIWHEEGDDTDGVTHILSVVDDPDISGNKLIQVDENQGPAKEMWKVDWHADPSVGGTLIFRAKALEVGTYDRDFDLYIYNGQVRERFVSNSGTEIKFDKSKQASPMNTDAWHIYRMTIIADLIEVFVDEDPLAYLSAQGEPLEAGSTENLFRFGDLGSSKVGSLFDWFIWDVSGAYPPETGTPIPQELLDTGSMSTGCCEVVVQPTEFLLDQNYPNPFNPTTHISFSIPETAYTTLTVFNALGQQVSVLINENLQAGRYQSAWHADQYPAGMYTCQLVSGNRMTLKKMVLLK
jgi:hypothetical protein